MFFSNEDREVLNNLRNQIQILSNKIELYEGARNTKEIGTSRKSEENLEKINNMTLELKGVVSQARAALSERKVFDEFIDNASKKLMDILQEGENKNSKKIDQELISVKKMITELSKSYNSLATQPYAKISCILSTLERIEQNIETKKKVVKKKKDID